MISINYIKYILWHTVVGENSKKYSLRNAELKKANMYSSLVLSKLLVTAIYVVFCQQTWSII